MNNHACCPTFILECAHVSDTGMRRLNNQDAVAVVVTEDEKTWATRGHLMMVADGMGAHAAGELASKLAVDNIPHTYFKLRDLYPPAALRQAIRDANAVIHTKGQSSVGFQGMGTTCSCLVLLPQGALVAHIGDSRVYRLRGSVLEQLTFDHSLVWEMAAAGQMAEEDVPAYIPKNVITRSLGPHASVNIDLEGPYNVEAGDVFLVCSDGLSGQVSDEEIGAILGALRPEEAVQTFVDLANLRGGPDNISIVVAKVVGNGVPEGATVNDSNHTAPVNAQPAAARSALLWLAVGGAMGVLAFCLANQYWLLAVAASIVLVAALVATMVSRPQSVRQGTPIRSIGGPYGNGPYRKASATASRTVVDALAQVSDKVKTLADTESNDWSIQWDVYHKGREEAAKAADANDYALAIRRYCHAIRDVMQQLREHRRTSGE